MDHKTPVKAIRAKCLDCSQSFKEVRLCPVSDCPLWLYRFGMRPESARQKYPAYMDPKTIKAVGVEEDSMMHCDE